MNIWIYHSYKVDEDDVWYLDPLKMTEEQKNKLLSGNYIHWEEHEQYKLAKVAEKDIMKKPICIEKIIKPNSVQEESPNRKYIDSDEEAEIEAFKMFSA